MTTQTPLQRIMTATFIYTIVGFVGPAVALLLTPLYTRALGVAGYGTSDLLQTFAHIAYTTAIIGMPTVLASMLRHNDAPLAPTTVASAMVTVITWACGICVLLWGVVPWLAALTHRPEVVSLMFIQLVAVPFGVVHGTLLAVVRLREAIRLTAVLTVVGVVVTALTRITLVLWWAWGVTGMVTAAALTHILNACIVIVWTRQLWWGQVDWALVRVLWRRGIPLIPGNLAMWMLLFQDRWLLAGRIDAVTQGHYALAATLVSLIALVIDPFKNAWQPVALAQPPHSPFIATTMRMYVAVAGAIVLVTGVWAPELLWLLGGRAAQPAAPLVWPLVLVPLCSGALAIVGLVPTSHGRTAALAWSTVAAALCNTALNLVLIPAYGAMGAGIATGIAALVMPVVLWWHAQRIHPHSYAYSRMLVYGVVVVAGAAIASYWPGIWERAMVCGGYVLVILWSERTTLRHIWTTMPHATP